MRNSILRLAALAYLAMAVVPSMALADSINVSILGKQVGVMDVPTYTASKSGAFAGADIKGNFTKSGIVAGGQQLLDLNAPLGLSYLQTLLFTMDKQQKTFRTGTGGDLLGTFSDPPQGGYTLRDGSHDFATDKTPWYSNIEPSGVAGDIPPVYFAPDQIRDTPNMGFAVSNGLDGLANVLNGKDGTALFETALIGVKVAPADNPMTVADERLTDAYTVVGLSDYVWGMSFKFVDDGVAGFSAADYIVTKIPLTMSSTISVALKGAYDKAGDNSTLEWKVNFVAPVPEPSTLILGLVGLIGLSVVTLRKKRLAV
jgi:hypothetical protein